MKIALALMAIGGGCCVTASYAGDAFDGLLADSGLRLEERANYTDLQPQANSVMPYEHALRHRSGALEVRFIVRPLNRIQIVYDDPHNAAPEPNHLFPLLFESITNRLAVGRDTTSSTFADAETRSLFNADWAAAAAFAVDPAYANGFVNGLLIGLHKNEIADAYTLFLYNDPNRAKTLISDAIAIMAFAARP